MADNKRYYWIKLKTDFYNQETIDFLLSQKNGCEYIVLYQMLCLNTANNNGEMSSNIGEMIVPYDIDKIVRDTKYFDNDTVLVALELYKRLGLIYEEEDKILRISNFNEMVGSETSSAKRVREHRERKKLLQCNTNVTQEIEIDKEIDIRDKSIEKDKDKEIDIENNLIISNRNDSVTKSQLENEFEIIWAEYPRKLGKANALKSYIKARKKGTTKEDVWNGLNDYLNYIKIEKVDTQYIKHGSTWFNQESWNDDYSIKRELTTKDLAEHLDFSEFH